MNGKIKIAITNISLGNGVTINKTAEGKIFLWAEITCELPRPISVYKTLVSSKQENDHKKEVEND